MLELHNITKDYAVGDEVVHALKGVTLAFRENEFVSILGQSGCGKSTMLNIIGGLDRYTDGDLIIGGRSTEYFKDADWDAYRNNRIGFVFQSYNLIPHLTVLGNVELAMTLSGVKRDERRRRALEALKKVGLENEVKKRPNQMSGGQMQRVAIARALVNNPDIILADEPTGALDSETSVLVMDILKEISKDKLVIMVTHNRTLAETYSTRIVSMLDGKIIDDTMPFEPESAAEESVSVAAAAQNSESIDGEPKLDEKAEKQRKKLAEKEHKKKQKEITKSNKAAMRRTSMSFPTAFALSARNRITKKGRTLATAIAGSIGIIGVALVLALSHGFTNYINDMETQMLASYPVTVTPASIDLQETMENMSGEVVKLEEYPDGKKIIIKNDLSTMSYHYNRITQDYLDYIEKMPEGYVTDITKTYLQPKVILTKNKLFGANEYGYGRVSTSASSMFSSSVFQPLLNNTDYVTTQYDVLDGKYPTAADEIAVVIGKDNSINLSTFVSMGFKLPEDFDNATFDDVLSQELKLVFNNEWYSKGEDGFYRETSVDASQETLGKIYNSENNMTLKVVGIMRIKESTSLSLFSQGIVYSPKLDEALIANSMTSEMGVAQLQNKTKCVTDVLDTVLSTGDEMSFVGKDFAAIAVSIKMGNPMYAGLGITGTDLYNMACQAVGASTIPSGINFYPVNFDVKADMLKYLDAYNEGKDSKDTIMTLDAAGVVTDAVKQIVDIMTYVLVAFAAISLVVSSVMISIITYASVVERTKEIGVLRAVGARKKDIMRVFNAETMIIGFVAGVIGVLFTIVVSFPMSALFKHISDGMVTTNLVSLAWWHAIILIGISVLLTFVAGMIPARAASKRDPVVALRSE